MDERFRKTTENKEYTATNGVKICSRNNMPQIAMFCTPPWFYDGCIVLLLRGTGKDDDLRVCEFDAFSKNKADDIKNRILFALKEWAEKWEGWDDSEVKNRIPENKFYEF